MAIFSDDFKLTVNPSDLVQFTCNFNAAVLFEALQQILALVQKHDLKVDSVDAQVKNLGSKIADVRVEMENKMNDIAGAMNLRVEGLRKDALRDLDEMKNTREDKTSKFSADLSVLRKELSAAKDSLAAKLEDYAVRSANADRELQTEIQSGLSKCSKDISALTTSSDDRYRSHHNHLGTLDQVMEKNRTSISNLYTLMDLSMEDVALVTAKRDLEARVAKLYSTPAFSRIQTQINKDKTRFESKFDNVHKRIGVVEQQLLKKADSTDLEELRDIVTKDDLKDRVMDAQKNIRELFTITEYTEKALSVGLERKAEKSRIEGLEEDMETLEMKIKEAIEMVGGNRFQQIIDKIGDIDHYVQKMDRRKVGRAELQRIAKRVQKAGSDHDEPENHLSVTGVGTSEGDTTLGDAAFVRYRCLSCNKPSLKLTDDTPQKMQKTFPPSSIMTSAPISPKSQVASATSSRQEKKLENYFKWVEGTHEQNHSAPSGTASGTATGRTTPLVFSSRPTSPAASVEGSDSLRKIRTSLVGTDNRLYQGLQEVKVDTTVINTSVQKKRHPLVSLAEHKQAAESRSLET